MQSGYMVIRNDISGDLYLKKGNENISFGNFHIWRQEKKVILCRQYLAAFFIPIGTHRTHSIELCMS